MTIPAGNEAAKRRRGDSWERVARALGERMQYHAYCPETDYPTGSDGIPTGPQQPTHPEIEDGLAVGCPFCADRAAYRMYERKAGRLSEAEPGTPVSLSEVRRTVGNV